MVSFDYQPALERIKEAMEIYRAHTDEVSPEDAFSRYISALVDLEMFVPENVKNEVLENAEPEMDFYACSLILRAAALANIEIDPKILTSLHSDAISVIPEEALSPLFISVPSHILFQRLGMAVATGDKGSFAGGGVYRWPTHRIEERELQASFLVRPITDLPISLLEKSPEYATLLEQMQAHVKNMDELTLDVLNVICSQWIQRQPKNRTDMLRITADDILEKRGLMKHESGGGRRGGYTLEQRNAIQTRMLALSNIWVSVDNMKVTVFENNKRLRKSTRYESPAVVITGRFGDVNEDGEVDVWTWNVRPGDVFAEYLLHPVSRETALLAEKALSYDPYRRSVEKLLSFYISWQWRIRQGNGDYLRPYRVRTLLEAIQVDIIQTRAARLRAKLEKALDNLCKDGIIADWQYSKQGELPRYDWLEEWLGWTIIIEPPPSIITHYLRGIKDQPETEQMTMFTDRSDIDSYAADPAVKLRLLREKMGLSQGQMAEKLGVTRSLVNLVENGRRSCSDALKEKIEAFVIKGNRV